MHSQTPFLFIEHIFRIFRSISVSIKDAFISPERARFNQQLLEHGVDDITARAPQPTHYQNLYAGHSNPQVTYDVFLYRVKSLKMSINDALQTPLRSTFEMKKAYSPHLKDLHALVSPPVVSYRQFCRRVNKLKTPAEEALLTPAKQR